MLKNISIDMSSIEDVGRWINILKSTYSTLRKEKDPTFVSKNDRIRKEFAACCEIIDTDISHIYDKLNLDTNKRYYVYAHCDPGFKIALKKNGKTTFAASIGMTHVPFYIGKGTGDRAYELNRNESHRKVRQKIQKFGKDVDVVILKDNLSEIDALCYESKLIDIFGLITQRNGYLVNLDEGVNASDRKQNYLDSWRELSHQNKNICDKTGFSENRHYK